jgi:hypothetical protein
VQLFNASVLGTSCARGAFGQTLTATQITNSQTACSADDAGLRCAKQFTHLVRQCGLPFDDLPSWGLVPSCTADCHAAIDIFSQLPCKASFDALSQSAGKDKLRLAWTKLQTCRSQGASMLDDVLAHRVALPPSPPPWLGRQRARHARPHGRHTKPQPQPFAQPPLPNPAPPFPGQQVTITGVALADGYLSDCMIFLDTDGSGALDRSIHPYTTTASRSRHGPGEMFGHWTLAFDGSLLTAWPRPVLRLLRSFQDTRCTDLATNLPPGVDLAAPLPIYVGSTSVVISPLSSYFTALRSLNLPDNSVTTHAQHKRAVGIADYEAARSLAWGLGLPALDEPRTLLAFDPLLELRLHQDSVSAVDLVASSHTLRTVEMLHAAFPLDEPAAARNITARYSTMGGFSALAHRLSVLSGYPGNHLYLSRPCQVAAAFQFSSWDSLSSLLHIVVSLLLESGVQEKAGVSWELADNDVTALIPVISAAIEEALSVEAYNAARLEQQLSAIAIATRLHVITCLTEHQQTGPSCRQIYNRAAFAAAVDAILGRPQRASIGCAQGCGPDGWDGHLQQEWGSGNALPPVGVVGQVQGPTISAFIACAFVLVSVFLLAARRGLLPLMLARRMPPILGPSRHAMAHDARGVWVPIVSPLYAHIQMYSTDSPPSSVEGRGRSPDRQQPTRAATTEPVDTLLRSGRSPLARPLDPSAPLMLRPAAGVPLISTGDEEEEEIPIAPSGFRN